MKNDEIRAANRKALPKFLLLTLVGAVIGGIAGYCAARYGLDQLSGVLANASAFFGTHIAPWRWQSSRRRSAFRCTGTPRRC